MAAAAQKVVYTLGTSTREREEFRDLLRAYGIVQLVDVRRFPTSRLEHFKKENLAHLCREAGIAYYWLGEVLGGFRSGGYEAYMKTAEFLAGIQRLEEIARRAPTAFACAERFPWKCHRRFIAAELTRRSWRVIHIIEKDKTWEAKQLDLF